MINRVYQTITEYNMIGADSVVLAAVSGGSDSMAMLHILSELKSKLNFNLKAIHVNHCIRGEDADMDERFVEKYCSDNGIPLTVCRCDVVALSEEWGVGLEEAGRKVRYGLFEEYGKNSLVATAHNLSDRVETFLFNFTRGSSLRGLGSIPPVRDNFIRPLIDCTKAEIEAYCDENGVPYVTDKTNSDIVYSRNRIRHNVLSELREINPSVERTASRCIDSLREDEAYLSQCADELVLRSAKGESFDAKILASAPNPVKKRAIVRIIESVCGVTPEYKSVEEICFILSHGGVRQINGGRSVRIRGGMLEFPGNSAGSIDPVALECGTVKIGNRNVSASIVNINEINSLQNISNKNQIYCIDYDKINGNAVFRSRNAGDKLSLRKRGCTKSLKKLFNELSVPPEKRESVIILSDDSGVLLVDGIGVDARAEISANTEKVLCIGITE
ncbi:MAG: tRNA lysidine(34) synthetase TilS [Clostridia bacterium]|nr:tRNA lysidine(34) synthetase TilS [Clostridia bacterium]